MVDISVINMSYKINQPITVRYKTVPLVTLTDLYLTPTNPSGVDQSDILMTQIGTTGIYTANFTPNATGTWQIRAFSSSDTDQRDCKSFFVGTEYDLYPAQENGHLLSLDTKVGEVQTTPTTNTILGRLKDIYDKLVSGLTVTLDKVKIWNGTNIANVDTQGRLYVYIPPSQANTNVQLCYEKSEVPIKSLQWQDVVTYTVPNGYDFGCIEFSGYDNVNNGQARAINRITFGTINISSGVFTDGSSWTLPKMASKLNVFVTSAVGGTNTIITITYINQDGVAGRTATITLKSNIIGERIDIPLQQGDYGIIDITNITRSFSEAGEIKLEGTYSLFYELLTVTGTMYTAIAPLGSITVPQGDSIILQYNPSNNSNVMRRVSLLGALVPR